MYRIPDDPTATPTGPLNCAVVAADPSPEKLAMPFPASVVRMPAASTFKTL
jgi:hypothetical protein